MSKKYFILFAATSMAFGTVAVRADDQVTTQNRTDSTVTSEPNTASSAVDRNGIHLNNKSDDKAEIRKVLANVTEDAVKGKTSDVADYFTSNTKSQFNRSGRHADNSNGKNDAEVATAKTNDDQLKNTSKMFRDDWKAKYGHDFGLNHKNEPMVYSDQAFMIQEGAGARQASGQTAPTDSTAGEKVRGTNKITNSDIQDRMASVTVPESHGMPAISLSLVNEATFGDKWRIQAPAGLNYANLSSNLNQALTDLSGMKDQWSSDENQAYQAVSHRILSAIVGTAPGNQATGATPSDTAQPAGSTQAPAAR